MQVQNHSALFHGTKHFGVDGVRFDTRLAICRHAARIRLDIANTRCVRTQHFLACQSRSEIERHEKQDIVGRREMGLELGTIGQRLFRGRYGRRQVGLMMDEVFIYVVQLIDEV